MVDNINKRGPVSPNLEGKIDNIKGAEGNKRKIDTRNELNQLSNLLSGNSEWSSIERGYLEEEIKIATEYIERKEAKDKQKAIDNELFSKCYAEYKLRKINKVQLAEKLGISRPTLDKLLKDKGLAAGR
jgi:DNA-binding NtrC family response regulator